MGKLFAHATGILLTAIAGLNLALLAALPPVVPAAVAADNQVPFKGHIKGVLEQQPLSDPPINWSIRILGTGQATHLGRVSVDITNGDVGLGDGILVPNAPTGSGTFTGPKGDKVFGVYSWTATPTLNPLVLAFSGTFTITGGEGRFAGATGGGKFQGTGDMSTNLVTATFDGTISAPGSPKK